MGGDAAVASEPVAPGAFPDPSELDQRTEMSLVSRFEEEPAHLVSATHSSERVT